MDERFAGDPYPYSPDWDQRVGFAAQFIKPGLRVMDLGCGAMTAEKILKAGSYLPVDIKARDDRIRELDLNRDSLPADWLADLDLVVMMGLIEYLDDPFEHCKTIARQGVAVLLSYNPAEFRAPGWQQNRWRTNFTVAEVEKGFRGAGFVPFFRFAYSETQTIWLFLPTGYDASRVTSVRNRDFQAPLLRAPDETSRPRIAVAAFLGRGNCGDEAIFQVVHETFAADYDVVASVDEHGAYGGYWDWYPYTKSRIIHQGDLASLAGEPTFSGLIVGGGGLPPGFVADQILVARMFGIPVIAAGVDIMAVFKDAPAPARASIGRYLDLFDLVATRSQVGTDIARDIGVNPVYGTDWALRLKQDEAPDTGITRDHVAVVIREVPLGVTTYANIETLAKMIDDIRKTGAQPFFLPFAPEDERFVRQLGLDALAPTERHWWNPRRVKQLIAEAGAVLSVGRLHPIVFAASTRTPVECIAAPMMDRAIPTKLNVLAPEMGVSGPSSVEEAVQKLAEGRLAPSDPDKLAAAEARFDIMADRIRTLVAAKK